MSLECIYVYDIMLQHTMKERGCCLAMCYIFDAHVPHWGATVEDKVLYEWDKGCPMKTGK